MNAATIQYDVDRRRWVLFHGVCPVAHSVSLTRITRRHPDAEVVHPRTERNAS